MFCLGDTTTTSTTTTANDSDGVFDVPSELGPRRAQQTDKQICAQRDVSKRGSSSRTEPTIHYTFRKQARTNAIHKKTPLSVNTSISLTSPFPPPSHTHTHTDTQTPHTRACARARTFAHTYMHTRISQIYSKQARDSLNYNK